MQIKWNTCQASPFFFDGVQQLGEFFEGLGWNTETDHFYNTVFGCQTHWHVCCTVCAPMSDYTVTSCVAIRKWLKSCFVCVAQHQTPHKALSHGAKMFISTAALELSVQLFLWPRKIAQLSNLKPSTKEQYFNWMEPTHGFPSLSSPAMHYATAWWCGRDWCSGEIFKHRSPSFVSPHDILHYIWQAKTNSGHEKVSHQLEHRALIASLLHYVERQTRSGCWSARCHPLSSH